MVTRKAKFLSKDETRGLLTNTIYDIDTHMEGEKIVVELLHANRQAKIEYISKRDFLKDWLVID